MALTADYTRIKEYEKIVYENGELKPRVEALVFVTMFVGMGELSEKNFDEFLDRITLWEKVNGSFLKHSNEEGITPVPFTQENLKPYVGLRTNASTKTRKRFLLELGDIALEKLTGRRFLLVK